MSDTDAQVPLPDLNAADVPATDDVAYHDDEQASRAAADLEAVFDVPVQVSAVLRPPKKDVRELLRPRAGTVPQLDPRVGEGTELHAHTRPVARGVAVLGGDK